MPYFSKVMIAVVSKTSMGICECMYICRKYVGL